MSIKEITLTNFKTHPRISLRNENGLFSIKKPTLLHADPLKGYESYLFSLECLLEHIIPTEFFSLAKSDPNSTNIKAAFEALFNELPIIYTSIDEISTLPDILSFVVLMQGERTHGGGRFIVDMLIRWLIPGKQLPIEGQRSFNLEFSNAPDQRYYLCENFVRITEADDLLLIKKNLPGFIKELRQIILSVYRARYIAALHNFSAMQKSAIIKDSISDLLKGQDREGEISDFDQVHDFFLKFSTERKLSEIRKNLSTLMKKKPRDFDRDIFEAMHHLSSLFKSDFTSIRDPRYIARIISYQYIFQKIIQNALEVDPTKRHMHIRLMRTFLNTATGKEQVLGILLTTNFLNEIEKLDQKLILDTISSCNFDIKYIENSYAADRRKDKIQSFYLEIAKGDRSLFSVAECKELKERLIESLESHLSYNPVFLPSNDEETMRNIILLANQLKYVGDLPQLVLSYSSQTNTEIVFTAILVRLLKGDTSSLKELFSKNSSILNFVSDEVKIVGKLKKKYLKEANTFHISLKKDVVLRKDFSLNIHKARDLIVAELEKVIGEFRDFNGGLLCQQSQALEQLKSSLGEVHEKHEYLLENFFYSIKPHVAVNIFSADLLKILFLSFLDIRKSDFIKEPYIIKHICLENYLISTIAASVQTVQEAIAADIANFKPSSLSLAFVPLKINGIYLLGYILKGTKEEVLNFQSRLFEAAEKA